MADDPNAPPRTPEEVERFVRAHYGYASWALDHPELGPVLRQAASEGWDEARLQGAIHGTSWWQSTTDQAREWDALSATDPASAWREIQVRLGEIERLSSRLGVTLQDGRAAELVRDSLRYGWSADEIQRAVFSEADYQPSQGGQIGASIAGIRGLAARYGLPMSERQAYDWTVRIGTGVADETTVEQELRRQAIGLYPGLAPQLQQGLTVEDVAEPYRQIAAELLERDPDQIQLNDPLFNRPLRGERPMALEEWRQTLMTDERYGWDRTHNARGVAVEMIGQLGRTFGVRS